MVRVGVNGFGRIGRNVLRAALERNHDVEFVAVNDLTDAATLAYLLKYDSVHARSRTKIEPHATNGITIDGKRAARLLLSRSRRDPLERPRRGDRRRVVGPFHVEGQGLAASQEERRARHHLRAVEGRRRHDLHRRQREATSIPSKHKIISNASCTTNCLAPVAKVLHERFGIEMGIMTTVHSYTNDQEILDLPHKDLRRGRAAALSMIPTTTGAAKAVGLVLPELKGKFDGISVRVPTPNVSLVDLTFRTEKADERRRDQPGAPRGVGRRAERHPRLTPTSSSSRSISTTTRTRRSSTRPSPARSIRTCTRSWRGTTTSGATRTASST